MHGHDEEGCSPWPEDVESESEPESGSESESWPNQQVDGWVGLNASLIAR